MNRMDMFMTLEEFDERYNPYYWMTEEKGGNRRVQAHGVFDILHLGHIRYLQQASRMGSALIVTITADEFVNKGEGRPFFKAEHRAEALLSMAFVTMVVLNPDVNAAHAIKVITPKYFVKGPECRYQTSVGLEAERRAIAEVGGEMAYTSGQIFSSTEIGRKVLEIA